MAKRQRPERDRPIRQRHKKSSKLPLILVVIAVIGGGLFALHKSGKVPAVSKGVEKVASQSKKALKKIKKSVGSKGTPGKTGDAKGSKAGTKKGTDDPGKTTPRRIDPAASERARAVLDAAEEHFSAGRFRQANEDLQKFIESRPAISSGQQAELEGLAQRAFNHHVLTRDYRLDARLEGDTTELKMIDGRTLEVRITSKDDDRIYYLWKGIKSSCKAAAVLNQRVIPASELKQRDDAKYGELLGKASGGGPRAFLRVIKFCVERDMRGRIPTIVAQAEREQKAEAEKTKLKLRGFFEELFEAKASILYQRYLTFAQRNLDKQKKAVFDKIITFYPDTTIARELQTLKRRGEPPKMEEEKQVIARLEKKLAPKETRTSNASARELLRKGDKAYAEAMKEYRRSFPGQPNADKHLRPAWDMFKKAQKLYEQAYQLDPKGSIEDKIALCQREIYSCQKQMKIK